MIKDVCQVRTCFNYGRYARPCGHLSGKSAKPKAIAPRSKKLAEVMRKEYVPQVKEMVEAKTPCKVKSPDCTGTAQGFHHVDGRENERLLSKSKIPCCNLCNGYIEKNDAWARANGLKLSKHQNYKRLPKV